MTVANELKILLTADDQASGKLSGVKGTLQGIGKVAAGALVGGVAAAGVAIAGVATKGVADFIKFEDQLNEVFTLLPGISGPAMETMKRQVLDASDEMGRLPNEVIPALYQSLSAGVPPDNVFEFLDTAHKASLGGVTDLETAVDGISSVVNAYGSEVVSAANASDIMFTAVRLGKTDFSQLSSSLFQVIPTAASLGVSFGDVSASLATLTSQGTPTSVATTQLRAALVEASKGGTKLDTAIKDLTGFSFPELIEQGTSMPGVFEVLRSSMPEQEFKDLFGSVEAVNAVLGITGPNFDKTSSAMQEMNTSAGATDAAFETMNQGMARTLEVLRAKFATTFIKIGDALAPVVRTIGDKLLGALDKLSPIVDGVVNAIGMFFDELQMGRDPLDAVGSLALRIASFILPMTETEFENLGESIFGIVGKVREFITTGREFITNLMEMIQPVIDAVTNFVSWKDILIALGVAIAAFVIPAIISIATTLAPIIAVIVAVVAIVALLRNAWENNWLGIRDIVAAVIERVRAIIETVVAAIRAFWAEHGDAIKAKALEIWGAIQSFISAAVETIRSVVTSIIAGVRAFWDEHGEAILATAKRIWGAIEEFIDLVVANIKSIVSAFQSAFEGDWRAFGEKLREAWDRVWNKIKEIVETLWPQIKTLISNAIDSIVSFFTETDWGEVGRNIIEGIANGITAAAGFIAEAARNAASAALDAAKGFLGIDSPSKVFMRVGGNVAEGFIAGITNAQRDVETAFGDLAGLATGVRLNQFEPGFAPVAGRTTTTTIQVFVTVDSETAAREIVDEIRLLQAQVIE